ncbi:hypothetical protein CUMW_102840 [Citrus unshiu]|nr:hypothetical protein CUMW_102840 [Citrus unshiu]
MRILALEKDYITSYKIVLSPKGCIRETLELSSDEFVTMILLDAVFLIELFLRGFYPDFIKSWTVDQLSADLWLLENQLPLPPSHAQSEFGGLKYPFSREYAWLYLMV